MIQQYYEGELYEVTFNVTRPRSRNCFGKCWPITTQCVISNNRRIIGLGEVVKHFNDVEDHAIAKKNSAKKAFTQITELKKNYIPKIIRMKLWNQILNN